MLEKLLGNIGGLDVGVIIAAVGYAVRVGVDCWHWWRDRKEQRLDQIFLDAINWVYINKVQAAKADHGSLTHEEAKDALAAATFKALDFARQAGLEVDNQETLPSRIQQVFARFKSALGNNHNQEVLTNG